MVAGFDKKWPLANTVWLTFSAKAKAEAAGGVGKQTDLIIVRNGGRTSAATEEEKARLYELFKRVTEQEAVAARAAIAEIDEYLKSVERSQADDATQHAASEMPPNRDVGQATAPATEVEREEA